MSEQRTADDAGVWCYIGRMACCGNLVAVMVDSEDSKKRTAKEVGSWIRQGMSVERVSLETFRALKMHRCECKAVRA